MTLAIKNFEDLLEIVNTHPEWRRRLVKALFPEIDMPATMQKMAETLDRLTVLMEKQGLHLGTVETDVTELKSTVTRLEINTARTDQNVSRLQTDVGKLQTDVGKLQTDVGKLQTDVGKLQSDMVKVRTDVGDLKGKGYEHDYLWKATAIFGRFIKRGRDKTNDVADLLQEAQEAGLITAQEFTQVMAADLLWGGWLREVNTEVIVVVESSWLAEESDVNRAFDRAAILRRVGLQALPVVAGQEWTEAALNLAQQMRVVTAVNRLIDPDSWQGALPP
jgi:septation ring formation regulator EzrA